MARLFAWLQLGHLPPRFFIVVKKCSCELHFLCLTVIEIASSVAVLQDVYPQLFYFCVMKLYLRGHYGTTLFIFSSVYFFSGTKLCHSDFCLALLKKYLQRGLSVSQLC